MDTSTEVIKARFDERGLMWDRRDIEKLVLTLLQERDMYKELSCKYADYEIRESGEVGESHETVNLASSD